MKEYGHVMREQSVRESKKLMDDYAHKEMVNEFEYRNKFSKFDEGMQKRQQDYNSFVMKPHIEKHSKLDMIERKNIAEYDEKRYQDEVGRDAWRKHQLMSTSNEVKNQITEKSKMQKLNSELGDMEVQRTTDRVSEINTFDQMIKNDKKQRQDMYRQMLNSQVQYNKGMKSFGNMTAVEKMMNRDDLKAYKVYDNNQYSMIPGVKNEKIARTEKKKHKKTSYEEDQRRLEAYGYGRYMKKAPTPIGVIENYGSGMAQNRNDGNNSFQSMNRSYNGSVSAQHMNMNNDAVPQSRRHQMSPRQNSNRTLMNIGATSMNQGYRPAGSPSAVYQHRNTVL
jgi:hypothetical protein